MEFPIEFIWYKRWKEPVRKSCLQRERGLVWTLKESFQNLSWSFSSFERGKPLYFRVDTL